MLDPNLLPPFKEGRDRAVSFLEDDTILYQEDANFPEPPLDINGYSRDPNNPLRFISNWPECDKRVCVCVVRYALCGCINLIMRCNNPASTFYRNRVGEPDCTNCPLR